MLGRVHGVINQVRCDSCLNVSVLRNVQRGPFGVEDPDFSGLYRTFFCRPSFSCNSKVAVQQQAVVVKTIVKSSQHSYKVAVAQVSTLTERRPSSTDQSKLVANDAELDKLTLAAFARWFRNASQSVL